jgi:tRNA(Ile)-lysidine synthase
LQAIVEQVLHARDDATPEIQNQGHFFKRYRQKLFCLNAAGLQRESNEKVWPAQESSLLMANGYTLSRVESASGISQRLWQASQITVSSRQGGEKIKLPGRSGHYDLKKLYQQAGITPWERETRPMVYLNGRLAAVAGLWIDEWAWSDENGCYQLQWKLDECD